MSVMRAALYLWGSPADVGYTEQGDAIELVRSRGWDLVTTYTDPTNRDRDVRKRPGVTSALRGAIARSYDVLVVSSIDRMFGTLHELVIVLEVLREHGVAFVSARDAGLDTTHGESARVLHELVGTFATFEQVIRKARLTLGLTRARRAGVRIGRPPLGRPRTGLPMKKVRALRAAGASWRAIERELGVARSVLHRALRKEAEIVPKSPRAMKPARDAAAAAP
jgi:DNA invertase Pin-like site-specific DNA recombinase